MSDKLKLEVLFAAIDKVTAPLKSIRNESKGASKELIELRKKMRDLDKTYSKIQNSSVNGSQAMAGYQQHLSDSIYETNVALNKQYKILDQLNARRQQANDIQSEYYASMRTRDKALSTGTSLLAGGAVIGAPVVMAVQQYASFEDAMLGVARQMKGARDENGKLTASYYEMANELQAMSERLPMAANELAAITEAGAKMNVQGKKDLLAYTETTAIMAEAFQLPVDEIGLKMGQVAELYKIPISNIKELGDTINWLDDGAMSQGGDIIDVLQRMAGTAATVNMEYKQAAALASSFLSTGSKREVAGTASNAVMRELAIATMQSKKFMEGLDMIKMSASNVQAGMSQNATGTILKVLDAINNLPKNKQLEATTRLFGKEFGDDVSKLANNVSEYRRQLQLVNDPNAIGSMDKEMQARLQNLNAQYETTTNQVSNLSAGLGSTLKPALIDVLSVVGSVLSSIKAWTVQHPVLTGYIVKGVAALAILLTALGALAIGFAAVLGPFAIFRYGFKLLAFMAPTILPLIGSIAFGVTALASTFFLAYQAGGLISKGIDMLLSSLLGYKTTLGGAIFDMVQYFKNTSWSQMGIDVGMAIIHGIEWGLDKLSGGLYTKLKNIATNMWSATKSALGINSPSRVFAELGGFTMQGLESGLNKGETGVLSQINSTAKRMAFLAGGVAITGTALAGNMQFDTRPPLAASAAGRGATTNHYEIHIHGTDTGTAKSIAQQVAEAIENIDRKKAVAKRSQLRDNH